MEVKPEYRGEISYKDEEERKETRACVAASHLKLFRVPRIYLA
jgi:hypothetical protein